MRYSLFAILLVSLSISACKKNCYRCISNTTCALSIKGTDTIHSCYTNATIGDTLKMYAAKGYHNILYSGLQYELNVCNDDSARIELEREEYTCTPQ